MIATENFKAINNLTYKSVERASSLGELNLRLFGRLVAHQIDAVNVAVEHSVRLAKLPTVSKGYHELFSGQVEVSKDLGEHLNTVVKENIQLAGQVSDDYQGWFQRGMAEVSADLRLVVPAV
jgi:hypothetical protein